MGRGPAVFSYGYCLAPSSKYPRGRLRNSFYSKKVSENVGPTGTQKQCQEQSGLLIQAKEGFKLPQHLSRPEAIRMSQSHQDCPSHAAEGSSPWGFQAPFRRKPH